MNAHLATEPRRTWLWPVTLCAISAAVVSFVDAEHQLLVAVFTGLVMGLAFVQRERDLWSLCSSDPLTGLANRRGFHERVHKQLARWSREPLALILVDCDHFKQINDRFGHAMGDKALEQVASALRSCVRGDDIVARWGGDEFVVLLRGTDEEGVRRVAQRVNALLRLSPLLPSGAFLSVSCGCVVRDAKQVRHVRLGGLLHAADDAMYAAKRRGGGQLVSWKESPSPFDFEQMTPPIHAG